MKFGTSIDMLSMGEPVPSDKVANNVDTFELNREELSYVNSLDAQRYANKEALETVLKAAQHNYQRQLSRITTMRDAFISHLVTKHKISQDLSVNAIIVNGLFIITNKGHGVPANTSPSSDVFPASADYALNLLLAKCSISDTKDVANLLGYSLGIKELSESVKTKLVSAGCAGIFKGIHEFSYKVNSKDEDGKELLNAAYKDKNVEVINLFISANFNLANEGKASLRDSLSLMRGILKELAVKYTSM